MKIEAAVLEQVGGDLAVRELDMDEPMAGEVIVRLAATGICHTDLVARGGDIDVPRPIILGHEGSGVVEAIGNGVTKLEVGDHVVMTSDTCGACRQCRNGTPTYCESFMELNFNCARENGDTGYSADGAVVYSHFSGQSSFATHTLVREQAVVKVPRDAPLELLGPFGCAVQTGAGAVMNALRPRVGSSIVIFGAGSVGLSAIMGAAVVGCGTIIAVDVQQPRLDLAAELGATHGILAPAADVVEQVRAATGGLGADFALDLTGVPGVMNDAVHALGRRGACGLIGIPHAGASFPLDIRDMMDNGKSVRGMVQGDAVPDVFIPQLVELFRQGRMPLDRLATRFRFDEINEALKAVERGDVIKAIVVIDDTVI